MVEEDRHTAESDFVSGGPRLATDASTRSCDITQQALSKKDRLRRQSHGYAVSQFNIEDLSQSKPLLLMFDSRSRNFPSLFANTDLKTLQVGIKTLRFVPRYIRGYTMYLNGQHTWETYGRIVSWEEDPNAITKYWQGVAPDPGLGILILDNQQTVLRFLANCCLKILHDIPLEDLFKQSLNSIPPPLPRLKDKVCSDLLAIDNETLAVHILEAPYRTPDTFGYGRLRNVLDAKHCQVQDHLLLLREDPGYFAECIQETSTYTGESLVDWKYTPRFSNLSEGDRNQTIGQVLHH
ncbi:MAG: hypothetical protein Q9226_004194 [Calogaya cf. arnoldii]